MKKTISKIETVKRYMRKYPEASVGEMSHDLEIPKGTLYNYIKKIKIQQLANEIGGAKIRMQSPERMQSTDHVVSLSPIPDIFKSPRQGETVDNVNHPPHYKVGRAKIRMQSPERMQSPLPDEFKSSRESEIVDNVNHPPHYKVGGIETIDFIEAKKLNYNLGNAIKYLARADHKNNREEDLKKARWYLDREIMSQHISK